MTYRIKRRRRSAAWAMRGTSTVMANGDVVITAGADEAGLTVPIPEVWSHGTLRALIGASRGWNFITIRVSVPPFASGTVSSQYASHSTASVKRSAPADGSITCGTKMKVDCNTCHGLGKISCPTCSKNDAAGKCPDCDKGRQPCKTCEGTGMRK